jgi:hypothetical protein
MPASAVLLTIQTDTKAQETQIVQEFLTRLQYSPDTFASTESPDFEISIGSKTIGVEVTKYYADFTKSGSKAQGDFSEWIRFARKLKESLQKIDPAFDRLYGAVHFRQGRILYKTLLEKGVIQEFVMLLRSNPETDEEGISVRLSGDTYPVLSTVIESVYLRNMFPETKYLWWNSRLQSGQVMSSDSALEHIIAKKEIAAKKYKTGYAQKWLIIYAGGLSLHDMYPTEPTTMLRQGKVMVKPIQPDASFVEFSPVHSDYFTHIFIWDKFTEMIYQLYPYFKKIFDYGERKIYINHLPLK